MSDTDDILADLAAGRIDVSTARQLLVAAKAAADAAAGSGARADHAAEPATKAASEQFPRNTPASQPPADHGNTLKRVNVRAVGRRVRIIGDAAIASVVADGPHVLRRAGSVLEVTSDGEIGPSLDSFNFIRPPRNFDDLRNLGLGKELVLHVNPTLDIDVEVTAGSLSTSELPVLSKVRVTAGGASLHDVKVVTDALVQAGSLTVRGPIGGGRSRIRVESGQLTVVLEEGSDVTVHADAQMGRVTWPDNQGPLDEYQVGAGQSRLDVGVVMGYATVRLVGDQEQRDHDSGSPFGARPGNFGDIPQQWQDIARTLLGGAMGQSFADVFTDRGANRRPQWTQTDADPASPSQSASRESASRESAARDDDFDIVDADVADADVAGDESGDRSEDWHSENPYPSSDDDDQWSSREPYNGGEAE